MRFLYRLLAIAAFLVSVSSVDQGHHSRSLLAVSRAPNGIMLPTFVQNKGFAIKGSNFAKSKNVLKGAKGKLVKGAKGKLVKGAKGKLVKGAKGKLIKGAKGKKIAFHKKVVYRSATKKVSKRMAIRS